MSQPSSIPPLVDLILDCVHREYPNHVSLSLRSDDDLAPPRTLHPAFFGSFDWHSAVHGHWSLARAWRTLPEGGRRDRCLVALRTSLTAEKLTGELDYFHRRPGFECPYGIAWLHLLAAELETIPELSTEREHLEPLREICETQGSRYLTQLTHAVRSGQHDQSAFGLGIFLDAARLSGREAFAEEVESTARRLHLEDRDTPLHLEPSNHDFLSATLSAADLVARILPPPELAEWLGRALPHLPTDGNRDWLTPIDCPDPSDGRLSHRIGLNLSRAWMLAAIAEALPTDDPRIPSLLASEISHREAGVAGIDPEHYSGTHWLGTFAIFLLTGRAKGPHPLA